jgi:hypothetical protein
MDTSYIPAALRHMLGLTPNSYRENKKKMDFLLILKNASMLSTEG